MKLTKLATGALSQAKEVPGLLSCHIDYEIKAGKGRLDYTGPKFDPAMWHQVLSFFRWTYKEMDSESQVRLYVNAQLGRWGAWAFPQEAGTGMSARELVTVETPEQAVARFASWGSEPSGDWVYFGTVHHHCSASAFQSGTDEENERNQDGLHLTVGRMEAERHDLHARFYLAGNCFAPDLACFWPVDPELAAQVPASLLDELARFQMGQKVVVDFPDAWHKNVVPVAIPLRGRQRSGPWQDQRRLELPEWLRAEQALREIQSKDSLLPEGDCVAALHSLIEDPALSLVVTACLNHQVAPEDILREVRSSDPAREGYPPFDG